MVYHGLANLAKNTVINIVLANYLLINNSVVHRKTAMVMIILRKARTKILVIAAENGL
jgi:hypothetical protein